MAEGAPLLREYAGKNLHPGFESLSLRQTPREAAPPGGFFLTRPMPDSPIGLALMFLSFGVTFFVARRLGESWRAERRRKAQEAARAGESRQARRQRERKAAGK